jgi:tetratricopeptide (TPR) repeat protein
MKDAASADLCVRVLGPFEVTLDSAAIPETNWPRKRTKTLLKVLLTAPGQAFSTDQLIDALLPDAEVGRATAKNVQSRISELRRVLEPGLSRGRDSQYIVNVGDGYAFSSEAPYWLDTVAFMEHVERADTALAEGRWAPAAEGYEEAVQLYQGEFLPEDLYAEWSQAPRARLKAAYIETSERLATCYLELGRHRQAIHWCQRTLAIVPHRESAIRLLMRCYAEVGERSKAIEAYDAGAEALRQRLDIEPSEELRILHDRIAGQTYRSESATGDSRRIAVIPFVSVGSDPSAEFLADGMTEELIYTLSKVAGLEVIAQTTALKYKGVRKSVAEIGQELQVGSLLEGSVQKVRGKGRILVQLINVESEAHLWAEQYDREIQDVLGVQGDIARSVASALKIQLLAKEETALRKAGRSDLEPDTCYMRGRLLLTRRTPEACLESIQHFQQAISINPDHPRAFTGLADAYCILVGHIPAAEGYEKAQAYAEQALALDPTCAEAHASHGAIAWLRNRDVQTAEDGFLRAIELNPNYALAHELYASLLQRTGRVREACERSEIALALDPFSANLVATYATSLHVAGRLVEAVDQYEKALELEPTLHEAWWGLWYCLAAQWDWDQAETVTRRWVERYPGNPYAYVNVAQYLVCRGRIEEGLENIRKALAVAGEAKPLYVLIHAGYAHCFARQYDKAINYLRDVLGVNPHLRFVHNALAKCYIQQGRYDKALEELDDAERISGGAGGSWAAHSNMDRGMIYARRGETEKAEEELAVLARSSGRQNRYFAMAGILFALGRPDEAMDSLEAAAKARESHVATLREVGTFDGYRSHPRFQALLKRMGLVD